MTIKKPLVIEQPKLGQLIHELRTGAGLTQEQFATHLGVTYSTVNRWENGRSKLSPLAMQKIENLLQEMGKQGQKLLIKYLPTQPDENN
ncbi:helix-turn-helix transcriptional regulator (plasmid) [Nostoc sp. UHCC 0302]|uniref:helix-turn-helix domain-containing protein n=1 Tax=Nostoc sp. UHCC 0302 TaxID=3134896 RepID=UPI00311C9918